MSVEGRRRARWGAPESSAADLRAAAARAGRVTATHRPSNAISSEDYAARERGFSTCVTVDYRAGRAAGPAGAKKTTRETRARASPASSRRTWRVGDPVNASTRGPGPGPGPGPEPEPDDIQADGRDDYPDDFEDEDEDEEDEETRCPRASTRERPPLSPTIPNRGVPPPPSRDSARTNMKRTSGAAGTRAPRRRAAW